MDCWKHRTGTGDGGVHDGFEVWPDASAEGVCGVDGGVADAQAAFFSWRPELATKLCWAVERAGSQRGTSGGNVGSEEHASVATDLAPL